MIVLLSGERRVGKSTVCQKLMEIAGRRGKSVGGLLSVALFDDEGEKTGIKLLDPCTGAEHLLASIRNRLSGPQVGVYHMSAEALQWGTELGLAAFESEFDLIVIDELGPLELLRGEGFAGVLPALYAATDDDCLIVVRPELIDELEGRLKSRHVIRCIVTPDNRDGAPCKLAQVLWGEA